MDRRVGEAKGQLVPLVSSGFIPVIAMRASFVRRTVRSCDAGQTPRASHRGFLLGLQRGRGGDGINLDCAREL